MMMSTESVSRAKVSNSAGTITVLKCRICQRIELRFAAGEVRCASTSMPFDSAGNPKLRTHSTKLAGTRNEATWPRRRSPIASARSGCTSPRVPCGAIRTRMYTLLAHGTEYRRQVDAHVQSGPRLLGRVGRMGARRHGLVHLRARAHAGDHRAAAEVGHRGDARQCRLLRQRPVCVVSHGLGRVDGVGADCGSVRTRAHAGAHDPLLFR